MYPCLPHRGELMYDDHIKRWNRFTVHQGLNNHKGPRLWENEPLPPLLSKQQCWSRLKPGPGGDVISDSIWLRSELSVASKGQSCEAVSASFTHKRPRKELLVE